MVSPNFRNEVLRISVSDTEQLFNFTPRSVVPGFEFCKQMRFLLSVSMGNVNDRHDCVLSV